MARHLSANLLEVGRILKPHGLKGEVRVQLHWVGSEALNHVSEVLLRKEGREIQARIASVRDGGKGVLLSLNEVADRTAAEAICGASVWVDRAQLPKLKPGEYYLADLIGAQVVAPDGALGKVVDLSFYPSMDCLIIETLTGARVEQPLLPHWIGRVDVTAGRIDLSSRDGLIEGNGR
ncbi:MAG TPA: ribosome maturation factor RimM [Polyangiaceae bacterium]|nr:ribosome maturation factor RimM [Polyangiaceae bacterium]